MMVSVFDLKPRARRAESSRSSGRSRVVRVRFTMNRMPGVVKTGGECLLLRLSRTVSCHQSGSDGIIRNSSRTSCRSVFEASAIGYVHMPALGGFRPPLTCHVRGVRFVHTIRELLEEGIMLKWLMRRAVAVFERQWSYDASYLHELIGI